MHDTQAQDPQPELTLDQAVAEFQATAKEALGDAAPDAAMPPRPATPEEAEARRFRVAEFLLSIACPNSSGCDDQRCRRDAVCRHLARVRAKQASGKSTHPRRSPGAEAVRYAMWVCMSVGAQEEPQGTDRPTGR